MSRNRLIPFKQAIFIGVEGQSDEAFVAFLKIWCKHLSLISQPVGGGSSVAVVQNVADYLSRNSAKNEFLQKLVLLDTDRIEQDKNEGLEAKAVANQHGLTIIFQTPNLEGVLLRLHKGSEQYKFQDKSALTLLKKKWPKYHKGRLNAYQLETRFKFDDVLRAAKYDEHLHQLLTILGLLESP